MPTGIALDELACGTPFRQQGDHREHHGHFPSRGRAEDRAHLSAEQLRPGEREPHAALAKKRVRLGGQGKIWDGLVATDVQRPDDENTLRPQRASDGLVGLGLLVLVRRRPAIHEQELGPQEPDAFPADFGHASGLALPANVRHDLDALPVASRRRLGGHRQLAVSPPLIGLLPLDSRGLFLGGGRRLQCTVVTVQDDARARR